MHAIYKVCIFLKSNAAKVLSRSEPDFATALSRVELAEGVSPVSAAGSSRSSGGHQTFVVKYIKDKTSATEKGQLDHWL